MEPGLISKTVGGSTYGVAKKVRLYAVKIIPKYQTQSTEAGSNGASLSTGLEALEFVENDSQTRYCPNGTVVNMSIGITPVQHAFDDMVKDLHSAGIFVVVAAGNKNQSASCSSPSSEPSACTVGAMDNHNHIADFSNHGPLVDILAPGVNILSAGIDNTTASVSHSLGGHDLDIVRTCGYNLHR